jgi:putative ubiquitin-RnfH superfamily antitoxin RatB of RatAB toxin-antitoxin module
MSGARLRVHIAYATPTRQFLWPLELAPATTIAQALEACRARVGERVEGILIPWESAAVGVFGELRARSEPCAEGDRIELYRALAADPRAQRRERVARKRGTR